LAESIRIEARPNAKSASIGQDQLDAPRSGGSGVNGDLQKCRRLRLDGVSGWHLHLTDQTAFLQRPPPAIETRLTQSMTPTERPDAEFRLLPKTNEIEPMTLFP
jgi:hypothetical protein